MTKTYYSFTASSDDYSIYGIGPVTEHTTSKNFVNKIEKTLNLEFKDKKKICDFIENEGLENLSGITIVAYDDFDKCHKLEFQLITFIPLY